MPSSHPAGAIPDCNRPYTPSRPTTRMAAPHLAEALLLVVPLLGMATLDSEGSLLDGRPGAGSVASRGEPTLLVSSECECPATVEGSYLPTFNTCRHGGATQPCFLFTIEALQAGEEDTPGQCQLPQPEPPAQNPCPQEPGQCSFAPRTVKVLSALCVANGCGTGPWQLHDAGGQAVGKKFDAGGQTREVAVSVANLWCRNVKDYKLQVKDATGAVAMQFNVRSKCDKCPSDQSPYAPPPPQ